MSGLREDVEALAVTLIQWAETAEDEAEQALKEDNLGRCARLRGTAHGYRVAAAELSRLEALPCGVEEGERPDMPCIWCGHRAGDHDVEAACWVDGCPCGSDEPGDPQAQP